MAQERNGWIPVNPKDHHVVEIANSAAKHYHLSPFVAVVGGWTQNLKGIGVNYSLIIKAWPIIYFPCPYPHPYLNEVIVYEDLSGHLQYVSKAPPFNAEGPTSDEVNALSKLWKGLEDLKTTGVRAAGEKTIAIDGLDWTIGGPKDPKVIEIGEFAVAEHNKETGTKLEFAEVVSGLKAHALTFNLYGLSIRTKDGVHVALVLVAPIGYKKLLSWKN